MSERKIREWALPHVTNFRTYIDVGAGSGDTTFPFSQEFKTVYGFEPNPDYTLEDLGNVRFFKIALSDKAGTAELRLVENFATLEHGSIAPRRNSEWNGRIYRVPTLTLDSYNFEDVDLIKIDVEQGELEVINGALETIQKYKPVIIFENKRNENDVVITILEGLGYNTQKYKSDTVAWFEEKQ